MSDEQSEQPSADEGTKSAANSQPSEQASGEARTAEEAEQLRQKNQQLQQQLQQYEQAVNQYFSQQQQQQAAQAQQQQAASQPDYDDLEDEWLTSPGKASQRLAQQIQQSTMQQVNQMAQPMLQAQTETAKATAQQNPKVREVFEKYGHEIEQQVANLQPVHKANPKLWEEAANLVRSRHFDEFVQEKAQEIAAQTAAQSETGDPRGGRSQPSMRDELRNKLESSSYGRKLLDKYGADGLRDHVNRVKGKLGVRSFDEYVDMVAGTETIHDPDDPNQWKNKNLISRDR